MKYSIEGKEVSEETFDAFMNTLTEVEDTYHCAKTVGGGRNSYEATDSSGTVWVCSSITTEESQVKHIVKR